MPKYIQFLRHQVNLRVVGESEEERSASRGAQGVEYGILNVADLTRTIASSDLEEVINPLSVPVQLPEHSQQYSWDSLVAGI